jgi:prepilin-type N-terminal cleavage/methylation domain-containing protein
MVRQKRQHGFTLVEVLTVITVMGVVTGLVATMFVTMTDTWKRAKVRTDLTRQADAALEMIRQDLADTLAPNLAGAAISGKRQYLDGNAQYPGTLWNDRIKIPVQSADSAVPVWVLYYVNRQGDHPVLMRKLWPLSADDPKVVQNAPEQAVLPGAVMLRVEYQPRGGGEWQLGWNKAESPGAARISVVVGDEQFRGEQVARKSVCAIL